MNVHSLAHALVQTPNCAHATQRVVTGLKGNPVLIEQLNRGELTPTVLVSWSPAQLQPATVQQVNKAAADQRHLDEVLLHQPYQKHVRS